MVHFVDLNLKPTNNKETLLSVVAGDGKTFDHLSNLKQEYGEELRRMPPYIMVCNIFSRISKSLFSKFTRVRASGNSLG